MGITISESTGLTGAEYATEMNPRDERKFSNDTDFTEEDSYYLCETSYDNREQDNEKFLLKRKNNGAPRKKSWRTHLALSFVTMLNVVLFLTSMAMLSLSFKAKRTTDQDHWRATSFYCKSSSPSFVLFALPLTPYQLPSSTNSPSQST